MKNNLDFIGSYSFDLRLLPYDIIGSIVHVKMLAKCKILTKSEAAKIVKGLESIYKDWEKGKKIPFAEDVHYALEKELIKRIGPVGGKMHTARSRNDQVALDLRMYIADESGKIIKHINILQKAFIKTAKKNINVIMPGYTHLQHAQPVLFAHNILAYAWMFERDKERLFDCLSRTAVMPLGSAALAGTSFKIDRQYTAGLLGFASVSDNSVDAVSDRDFAVEFLSCASLISLHLSRLSEELVIWTSKEFDYIKIGDAYTSGSSIMPQKKNPDVAEIIRGKTGRVYGSLFTLLTIMKGLPLSYNRDMQEDKPPVFEGADTVKACLKMASQMVESISVNSTKMADSCDNSFLSATELADYLAKKGVPFRKAHGIVKNIVAHCTKKKITLKSLSLHDLKKYSNQFGSDVLKVVDIRNAVMSKDSFGGTSLKSVKMQIKILEKTCKHA